MQLEETFSSPLKTLSWADLGQFLYESFSPAICGMDIQSIYLFLWLKIPLLSEKLLERCTGVSFYSLSSIWCISLLQLKGNSFLYPSLMFSWVIYFLWCRTHSVPVSLQGRKPKSREPVSLVITSLVWIQYWQYCWRMLPLLHKTIFCCCLWPQLSVALNSLKLYLRYKIISIHSRISETRKSLKKRLLFIF